MVLTVLDSLTSEPWNTNISFALLPTKYANPTPKINKIIKVWSIPAPIALGPNTKKATKRVPMITLEKIAASVRTLWSCGLILTSGNFLCPLVKNTVATTESKKNSANRKNPALDNTNPKNVFSDLKNSCREHTNMVIANAETVVK